MKSIVLVLVLFLSSNIHADDDFGEEEVVQAKEHHSFVEQITAECIIETEIPVELAHKILLGDLTDESYRAKVNITGFSC